MSATATPLRHGTTYYYNKGCRCDECRAAKNRKRRERRVRGRAAKSESYERELARSRALKESYRGTCVDCGGATTGCYGPGLAPERCLRCSQRLTAIRRRGTGRVNARVLNALAEQPRRYMELSRLVGISTDQLAATLNRLLKYGLIERPARGLYKLAAKTDPL